MEMKGKARERVIAWILRVLNIALHTLIAYQKVRLWFGGSP